MPDYGLPEAENAEAKETAKAEEQPSRPAVDGGTSLAGAVGACITLLIAGLIGFALKRRLTTKS